MALTIRETSIGGVLVVETSRSADQRGTFARFYCKRELASVLQGREVVQINHSLTQSTGAIRGLHYQHPPATEMKLVRCLKGKVWDVAVDLRADSPTFLRWHAEELDPDGNRMLVIPEGCAHGFQVLENDAELLYLHTAFYSPQHENGIRYDDPRLRISWPLPPADISERDANHPSISLDFRGIRL